MTDRIKGFTVTLGKDIRDDDFETIENAVRMIKGVIHVKPSLSTSDDHMTEMRVKLDLHRKLFDCLN